MRPSLMILRVTPVNDVSPIVLLATMASAILAFFLGRRSGISAPVNRYIKERLKQIKSNQVAKVKEIKAEAKGELEEIAEVKNEIESGSDSDIVDEFNSAFAASSDDEVQSGKADSGG